MDTDWVAVRDDLWRTLQTVSEWVRVADAKAGATLAVDGVLLALLTGRLRGAQGPSALVTAGLSVALAAAAVSGLLAVSAIVPRMKRLGADSILHYGTIAAFESARSYHDEVVVLISDPEAASRALTRHIWIISRSAKRKYSLITWAIRLLGGSLIVGMFSLVLR